MAKRKGNGKGPVDRTVGDIKALKIQGASQVREKAVEALLQSVKESGAGTEEEFRKEFMKNSKKLFNARPTEPALRTALVILKKSISEKGLSVGEMKNRISERAKKYEKERQASLRKIARYGARLIDPGSKIVVHCHSNSLMEALKKARKKIDLVYCCETRPLFQGRISAKELAGAGIKTEIMVDNAASTVMKGADYFMTGADAFLADGDVINKIGTSQISLAAKKYVTPHYVFCSTHKFEPSTFFGEEEPIEKRDTKEVWEKKPKNVRVRNPSFDRTDSELVEGIVSEIGVFSPEQLAAKLYDRLDLEKHHEDFLRLK